MTKIAYNQIKEHTVKRPCRVATTQNINFVISGDDFTSAPTVVDGITLSNGDRVLVKNQSTGSQNGIFEVVSSGIWRRTSDFKEDRDAFTGLKVRILQGNEHGFEEFILSTLGEIIIGTTNLIFLKESDKQNLNQVLTIGNTTTGNDIIISNGDVIRNASNTASLNLRDGSDTRVSLKNTDGVGLFFDKYGTTPKKYLYLGVDNEGYNFPYLYAEENYLLLARSSTNPGVSTIGYHLITSDYNPLSISSGIFIKDNFSSPLQSEGVDNPAIIVGSKGSTVNAGVVNSVILGGEGLTATTNNTVYTQNLDVNGSTLFKDNISVTSGILNINNFNFDGSYLSFNNFANTSEIAGLYTNFNDKLILYNDNGDVRISGTGDLELDSGGDINLTPGTPKTVNITGDLDVSQELKVGITFWTFDLTEELTFTRYATETLSITEINNIVGTPTTTILVNGSSYILGDAIVSGDKIDIISDIISVVKLKIEK